MRSRTVGRRLDRRRVRFARLSREEKRVDVSFGRSEHNNHGPVGPPERLQRESLGSELRKT